MPQKQWEECLDCLAKDHSSIWNQSGICDAMISSRYELRCHEDVIFGLLEYWCPETNTLVFPWGEATITLEDIVSLVGLPVLREPVTEPLRGIRFAVAIHLSEGTKIALAPAVLASLYKNLRLLKEQAAAAASGSITVSGRLQIVQQWAFERFPLLGPQCPNLLEHGEPRAARWHKLNCKISLPLTRSVLKVPDNFKWLPYADNLDNRHHSSYYKEDDL
eukprot:XP_024449398.1 uncharacterized protein LOC18095954 [Populus trichocarpa]